ncbi:MAG: SCP2 sterol-binding domain-containing protein [Pseudomonadota bacterium]
MEASKGDSAAEELEACRAASAAVFLQPFGAVLGVFVRDKGALTIDGATTPPTILVGDRQVADCYWRLSADALHKILSGQIDVSAAVLSGRLRITGDLSVMARLQFGPATAAADPAEASVT